MLPLLTAHLSTTVPQAVDHTLDTIIIMTVDHTLDIVMLPVMVELSLLTVAALSQQTIALLSVTVLGIMVEPLLSTM